MDNSALHSASTGTFRQVVFSARRSGKEQAGAVHTGRREQEQVDAQGDLAAVALQPRSSGWTRRTGPAGPGRRSHTGQPIRVGKSGVVRRLAGMPR